MKSLRQKVSLDRKEARKIKKQHKPEIHMLRVLKEWNEWEDIPGVFIDFPHGAAKPNIFNVIITPDNGYWKGGSFLFSFEIGSDYPMSPPSVSCRSGPIYHPNIDTRGNICLNLLRPDWTAASTFGNVIYGLILLFESPNFNDPLPSGDFLEGMEPFQLYSKNKDEFAATVRMTMAGGKVDKLGDVEFNRVL